MRFNCPKCGKIIDVDGQGEGALIECPHCGVNIRYSIEKVYAGKVLAGFELQEMLGVGGMGEVWLAYQRSMDRQVAVKILSPYLSDDESFVETFLEEVKLAAKLEHPNIVSAFDAGVEDGIYYLAMSYVPGETFAVRVARERKLPEHEILEIGLRISIALDYAWGKFKILHRDVNPANIMLTPEGDIKLMDMGISKHMDDDAEIEDNLVGTPNYISPEQIHGNERLDERSDIYSLGATLYHLASGIIPFEGKDTYDVLHNQLHQELTPIEVLNPEISKPCALLINSMVQRDRELRPQSWGSVTGKIENMMGVSSASGAGTGTEIQGQHHKQVTISKDHIRKIQGEHMHDLQRSERRPTLALLVVLLALVATSAILALKVLEKREIKPTDNLKEEIVVAPPVADNVSQQEGLASGEGGHNESRGKDDLAELQRRKRIEGAWTRAQDLESQHPDRYSQLADEFERVRILAVGTPLAGKAKERVDKYRILYNVELVMRELAVRAQTYVSSKDYEEAARIYTGYSGRFSSETHDRRMKWAELYREQAAENKDPEKDKGGGDTLAETSDQFLSAVAVDFCDANLDKVVARCNSFQQQPNLSEQENEMAQKIKKHVEEIRSSDRYLFEALTSEDVKSVMVNHKGNLQKVGVKYQNGQLLAELPKGRGYAYFPLTIRQIPIEEKYRILDGRIDPVSRELYMGIYYIRKNLYKQAAEHFSNAGLLTDQLLDHTQQAARQAKEEKVRSGFASLLQAGGLLEDGQTAIKWNEIIDEGKFGKLTAQSAGYLLQQIQQFRESAADSKFLSDNNDSIEALCALIKSTDFGGHDDVGETSAGQAITVSDGSMSRLIQRARGSRGIPIRCNPTGSGSGIIPEVLKDKLNNNMILIVQKGNYNGRQINIEKKQGITIKAEEGVRNCSISLKDSEDIIIQSSHLYRIDSTGSQYVVVDSSINGLSSRGSDGFVHNSRMVNLYCDSRITIDHCLITSIGSLDSNKILIRNSVLYGMTDRSNKENSFTPCFRWAKERMSKIRIQNCLVYTEGAIGTIFDNEWHVRNIRRWYEHVGKHLYRMDAVANVVDMVNCIFKDPDYTDPRGGEYSLRFNSPARKASIDGKHDLGPTPDLKPLRL